MRSCVAEWLEETALKLPDKVAICDEWGSITFSQYRQKSRALARAIIEAKQKQGVALKSPVVVYLEKGSKMLASFMGTAYSGGFYSPIDVEMPAQRVDKILDILEPRVVVTTRELKSTFDQFHYDGVYVIYDEVTFEPNNDSIVDAAMAEILDRDLLYVLFTSGSTGVPKGVSVCHGSVFNYIDWFVETFGIEKDDSFGNQAPFYFDNSVLDIYSSLKTGATLFIIPSRLFFQPVPLLNYLKEHGINTIFWVPSALVAVSRLKALRNVDLSNTLKRVMFCGEVMPTRQFNVWRQFLPQVTFANLYGPTETDVCTYFLIDREFSDDEPLPIGRPIKNVEALVLDEEDNLVDDGEIGELCIRGVALAKGYYRNPEKTEAAFIQNPLGNVVPDIIYKTGDLVRWNERGELMYLSRKDFQIKHLGYRIELGEIENAASTLDGIARCCCLYHERRRQIILFVERGAEKKALKEELAQMLPEYMIPEKIIPLDKWPMNANGKTDRVMLKGMLS